MLKHRLLTALALAALTCTVIAATALGGGNGRLYQFRGDVVSASSGSLQISVTGGNRLALNGTIFLHWQGRVPTVIEPSQLKAGDRITVRVRAAGNSTLAQVEATAANHVGDHEPGQPEAATS